MAATNAFRKIDVDAYDEDRFLEDEDLANAQPSANGGGDEDGSGAAVKANVTNVEYKTSQPAAEVEKVVDAAIAESRSNLNKGNVAAALTVLLETPPRGRDPVSAKDKSTQAVMDVLSSTKPADISNVLKDLGVNQLDVLMKYIYRGMASPEKFQSGILLQWHDKVRN
jgi:actin related protein 2/3 complex subunit 5